MKARQSGAFMQAKGKSLVGDGAEGDGTGSLA
jgi:hypothetical protein